MCHFGALYRYQGVILRVERRESAPLLSDSQRIEVGKTRVFTG